MDDFNSSDLEFEEPVKPHFKAGMRSIASMSDSRIEDRKTTKKRAKTLQDTRGAPGSIYMRHLWLNRLEGYVRMNKISVDSTTGPRAETIMRCIETVVDHMKVVIRDKPAPQLKTVQRGLECMIEALVFKYPKFSLSKHESRRIETLLDALTKEQKLLRGRWSKTQWLGVALFEKMARAWLQAALDQGCLSWDVQISRLLSISLLVALGCRVGEVGLSRGYTEEFFKWEHVQLKLVGGSTLDHLEATVEICFEKAKKKEVNDNRTVVLRPLCQTSANVICTVKLLLIQALRGGNIKDAVHLDDALANASRRLDKTVQWRHPQRPVVPAICRPKYTFLDWEKPAPRMQLYDTTLQMGLVAGVLAHIRAHDWRRGAAKDLANLKSKVPGVADEAVARAIGQSRASLSKGITDDYVGGIDTDLYTARVESGYQAKQSPLLGAPFKKAKLDHATLTNHCEQVGIEPSKSGLHTARRHLYADQQTAWIETERNRQEPPTPLPASARELKRPLKQRTASQVNSAPTSIKPTQIGGPDFSNKSSAAATAAAATAVEDQDFAGFIDPQLLLHPGDQALPLETVQHASAVNGDEDAVDRDVQQITNILDDANTSTGNPEKDQDRELIGFGIMVENMQLAEQGADLLLLPASEYVDALSRINVFHNTALDPHRTTLDEFLPSKVPMGNSRDYPRRFLFPCPNEGCDYSHYIKGILNDHVLVCKPKAQTSTSFVCDQVCENGEVCNKGFATAHGLNEHVVDTHTWVPKKCPHGNCADPHSMFANRKLYANHLAIHHKPIDPTTCTFPECNSKTVFSQHSTYSNHLRRVHKLMSAKSRQEYLPERPKMTSHWPACECPIGGSSTCATVFKSARGLQGHLASKVHNLSGDDAKKITEEIGSGGNVIEKVKEITAR